MSVNCYRIKINALGRSAKEIGFGGENNAQNRSTPLVKAWSKSFVRVENPYYTYIIYNVLKSSGKVTGIFRSAFDIVLQT